LRTTGIGVNAKHHDTNQRVSLIQAARLDSGRES
jgi:hypothetical protein